MGGVGKPILLLPSRFPAKSREITARSRERPFTAHSDRCRCDDDAAGARLRRSRVHRSPMPGTGSGGGGGARTPRSRPARGPPTRRADEHSAAERSDRRPRRAQIASKATSPFGQLTPCPLVPRDSRAAAEAAPSCGQTVTRQKARQLATGQRPLRRSAKRASGEENFYSGIQTPKKSNPNWLSSGSSTESPGNPSS